MARDSAPFTLDQLANTLFLFAPAGCGVCRALVAPGVVHHCDHVQPREWLHHKFVLANERYRRAMELDDGMLWAMTELCAARRAWRRGEPGAADPDPFNNAMRDLRRAIARGTPTRTGRPGRHAALDSDRNRNAARARRRAENPGRIGRPRKSDAQRTPGVADVSRYVAHTAVPGDADAPTPVDLPVAVQGPA